MSDLRWTECDADEVGWTIGADDEAEAAAHGDRLQADGARDRDYEAWLDALSARLDAERGEDGEPG